MNTFIARLVLVVLFAPLGISAQISGVIMDHESHEPIPSAIIRWEGTDIQVLSDINGIYTIEKPAGSSLLIAEAEGYGTVKKSIISRSGKTDFHLTPENQLNEVSVSGEANSTGVNYRSAQLEMNITQSELRKAACCNLSESFETNASVDVSFTDAVTGTRQIEMLGLSGKYVLIQRENIPFARGLNSTSGLTFIPGPFVGSIQLTKGLSSVVNGYESISGQINVEFQQPTDAFNFQLNGYVNQGARLESNVWVGTPISDSWEMGTLLHYSNVPFAQDPNGDGFADMPTGSQLNLHNRWKYLIGNGWGGQFGFQITSDERNGGMLEELQETPSPNDWRFNQTNERYEVFGKTGYLSPEAPYRSIGFIYGASFQDRQAILGAKSTSAEQRSAYVNAIYQDIFGNTFHQYRTGLSFQYDNIRETLFANAGFPNSTPDLAREEIVPGAFFEYTYSGAGPLTVVAGLRTDYNSLFNWIVTPRVNVKYEPITGTVFRIGGGRGQRTPNVYTENINGLATGRQFSIDANPIQAEVAWNTGFSFSQVFLLFGEGATFTTDAFYTWFDNKLITDFDRSPYVYSTYYARGSNSLSVLSQLDFSPIKNLEVRLAYKYLRAMDAFALGEDVAFGIPTHRGFVNAAYTFGESGWKVDATWNWYGERRLLSTDYYPEQYSLPNTSPSYSMVHLQVNKTFGKSWEVYAGSENLLNYRQDNPVIASEDPYSQFFETNRVFAPIFGRMLYVGFYYNFQKQ